jgi:superfamily II DNA/RNA helicase
LSVLSTADIAIDTTTFAGLGVPAPLVAVLASSGITAPFPIQAATLPDALAGRDILGRAQTGSGKTLGFCLRSSPGWRTATRWPAARAALSSSPPGSLPPR